MVSQLSSTVSCSPSETITARSMTFCSSRMFPGHGYDRKSSRFLLPTLAILLPARLASR